MSDALVDFTGGISETIELQAGEYNIDEEKKKSLFKSMLDEMEAHSLMCGAIAVSMAHIMSYY